MERFTFLPHTADIRMEVEAPTLDGLFRAALEGMGNVLYSSNTNAQDENGITCDVSLEAPDTTVLLIDFLSEALTTGYEKYCIFYKVEFDHFTGNRLKARLYGFSVDTFHEDIKAVTYHEAEVEKNAAGNWYTKIIFDI